MPLYPSIGMPPMHCNVCGGRVTKSCDRHPPCDGPFIGLRDKFIPLFVIRTAPTGART